MRPRLKLFTGETRLQPATQAMPVSHETISLGEIRRILTEAAQHNRTWLSDFEEESVLVSPDLHDVMTSYWNLRKSA